MGKEEEWSPLEVASISDCLTFSEAMKAVRRAQPEGCRWQFAKPSGNLTRNAYFQCCTHVDCGRRLKLIMFRFGTFVCNVKGEHGTVKNEFMRRNSKLTLQQEAHLVSSTAQGSKPGQIWAHWNQVEAEAAAARGEDPLEAKKVQGDGLRGASDM